MQLEIISTIVSGLAIILSSYFAYIANRTNKKVNEKDYELSENLKYDILRIIATIRTMDFKAAISGQIKGISYSEESKVLNQLMISPSFLLMLQATPMEERQMIELYFHILAGAGNSNIPADIIRRDCHYIIDVFKDKVNFKGVLDITIIKAIHNLCEIESVVDSSYEKAKATTDSKNGVFESFIQFLVEKGVGDEDVNVFYCLLTNDVEGLESALKRGGNPNVTQREILDRYPEYVNEFNNKVNNQH